MTSRQDDMTNSIMESRPIETFAGKCKFFCQSKSLLFVERNWWNIFIIMEKIEEQKVSERSSYVLLKWLLHDLISYGISHNFSALKCWNEKFEAKLIKSW